MRGTRLIISVATLLSQVLTCGTVWGGAWTTYHGGPGLMGYTADRLGPSLRVAWRYRATEQVSQTPVSDGAGVYALSGSKVIALDMEGREVWVRDLSRDPGWSFQAPPMVSSGLVVAGSPEGTLFALEAGTGRIRWSYELGGRILGAPNWVSGEGGGNVLAVSQSDGTLHSIRLSDGTRVFASERTNRCDSSVAVDGGLVVYGNCDSAIYAFDSRTGRRTGKVSLLREGQVYAGVALADGMVYAGDRSGRLYAVDMKRGKVLWTREGRGGDISSTPAVGPETLVYASDEGFLTAVSRSTGRERWSLQVGGRPASPVIASDKVLASVEGTLLVIGLASGQILWEAELSDLITSPAVVRNLVLVGTEEGYVMALETDP